MPLQKHMDQDTLVIAPGEKLAIAHGADELLPLVREALDSGVRKILLDLSQVDFIDSRGVGQVVASYTSTKHHDGQLVLCGLTPRVKLVLQVASLLLILNIQDRTPETVEWR